MNNRFMRLIVMFDLPVIKENDRKVYTKFRRFLLNEGYIMIQYSIYTRICKNSDDIKKHETRLKENMPSKGNLRLLQVTEKQYENMQILCGDSYEEEKISNDNLIIFD